MSGYAVYRSIGQALKQVAESSLTGTGKARGPEPLHGLNKLICSTFVEQIRFFAFEVLIEKGQRVTPDDCQNTRLLFLIRSVASREDRQVAKIHMPRHLVPQAHSIASFSCASQGRFLIFVESRSDLLDALSSHLHLR